MSGTKKREDYDPEFVKMAEEHEYHVLPKGDFGSYKVCGLCILKTTLGIDDTINKINVK